MAGRCVHMVWELVQPRLLSQIQGQYCERGPLATWSLANLLHLVSSMAQ